jgi:PKD repeat protein
MSVQQVPVYYFPAGGIQITEDSVCFAQDIQFQGQSASNTNQWSWSFPGGNPTSSSQQAPLVNYANPGQYTATLIVTNAVGSDTVEQSVSILEGALASADLLQNGFSVQCTFTGVNQDSVLWAFGDGVISSILNPSHTYASPGTYLITLVAFHECGNDTIVRQVTFLPSSLDDTGEFSDVKIVPNPTSGVFLLHTEQAMLKEVTIEVRDLLGRRIELLTNAPLSAASPCLIDISVAEAGVYTIIVRSGDKSRAWLLVKTDR